MGRHHDPKPSLQYHQVRRLTELEDGVRDRYLKDATFHLQVKQGARVLEALYPDMDQLEAIRAALLMRAAMEPDLLRVSAMNNPGGLMDPVATAALMANLAARPVTYSGPHGLKADHNGEPVCYCGWDPAQELPRELVQTRIDAIRAINQHRANSKSA